MKKSMDYFKYAVFFILCSFIFALVSNLIRVKPLLILSSLSIIFAVMSTILWICSLMYDKFKYSKNVITIIMFGAFAMSIYIVNPQSFLVTNFSGFKDLDFASIIFVLSSLVSCIALIVLIARVMFPAKKK